MTSRTLLAAALALTSVVPLAAQSTLAPGTRVRVSAPAFQNATVVSRSAEWQTGTLLRSDSSHLTLRTTAGDELSVPLSLVRRIEVSDGTMPASDAWRRGARQGALIGAGTVGVLVVGVFILDRAPGPDEGPLSEDAFPEEEEDSDFVAFMGTAVPLMAGAAVVGGGLGAIFGSRAQERWTPVVMDRVRVAPIVGGGTGVSLSLRF